MQPCARSSESCCWPCWCTSSPHSRNLLPRPQRPQPARCKTVLLRDVRPHLAGDARDPAAAGRERPGLRGTRERRLRDRRARVHLPGRRARAAATCLGKSRRVRRMSTKFPGSPEPSQMAQHAFDRQWDGSNWRLRCQPRGDPLWTVTNRRNFPICPASSDAGRPPACGSHGGYLTQRCESWAG